MRAISLASSDKEATLRARWASSLSIPSSRAAARIPPSGRPPTGFSADCGETSFSASSIQAGSPAAGRLTPLAPGRAVRQDGVGNVQLLPRPPTGRGFLLFPDRVFIYRPRWTSPLRADQSAAFLCESHSHKGKHCQAQSNNHCAHPGRSGHERIDRRDCSKKDDDSANSPLIEYATNCKADQHTARMHDPHSRHHDKKVKSPLVLIIVARSQSIFYKTSICQFLLQFYARLVDQRQLSNEVPTLS